MRRFDSVRSNAFYAGAYDSLPPHSDAAKCTFWLGFSLYLHLCHTAIGSAVAPSPSPASGRVARVSATGGLRFSIVGGRRLNTPPGRPAGVHPPRADARRRENVGRHRHAQGARRSSRLARYLRKSRRRSASTLANVICAREKRTMHPCACPVVDRISGPDPGLIFTMSISGRHGTFNAVVLEHIRNFCQGLFVIPRLVFLFGFS